MQVENESYDPIYSRIQHCLNNTENMKDKLYNKKVRLESSLGMELEMAKQLLKEVVDKKISGGAKKKKNGKSMSNISDVFVPRGESAMS